MVTVAVNVVLAARLAVGVNVSVLLIAEYAIRPVTGVAPGPVSVKVVELMVAGFIGSLNVALTF